MVQKPLWHDAADYACRQHRGHFRNDGVTPYIAHPFRVAMTLQAVFGVSDPEAITAAILHDTLEDTRTDYEDLEERFGPWVASAVAALSDNKALPSRARRLEYHTRLAASDWRIILVKLADAHDNLLDSSGSPELVDFHAKMRRKALELLEALGPTAAGDTHAGRAFKIVSDLLARLDGGAQHGSRGSTDALENEKGAV